MLLSLALVFLCGMILGKLFELLKLPSLLGMLLTGILLGPYALNLLDPALLDISVYLRQIALIIILTRAGLNLDIHELKKVGRPAALMCFLPACFEIVGAVVLAPPLLGVSYLEAAIMGAVLGAVSPAVVVPRMLRMMETGYGKSKGIPQMLIAGASVDDVLVIVLFTALTGVAKGGKMDTMSLLSVPTSIVFGLIGGCVVGLGLSALFSKIHVRDSGKVLIILSLAFLMVTLEHTMTGAIGFSGLLAAMAMGAMLEQRKNNVAVRLSDKFSKLWVAAEILLFVCVGAMVDIRYTAKAGFAVVLMILGALLFRMLGVGVCMIKTTLTKKERLFAALAYTPKATVQAAIGGIPLTMGLACGDIVLTVAVLSILVTAPLGAILIDATYQKLVTKEKAPVQIPENISA